ncbi:MAG: hypothetical protein KC978_13785, partial [Candidatus Omnitrophica bacterium]|nr:hypothetical protein [Candidatus Omnitrophota bacterium]
MTSHVRIKLSLLVFTFTFLSPGSCQIYDVNGDLTVGPHEAIELSRLWKQAAPAIGSGTSSDAWSLTGNSGTDPNMNFLGTTDFQNLELRVNGTRALLLELSGIPNLIGGHESNGTSTGVGGGVIAGGGQTGGANRITDDFGSVGGGSDNQAG